MRGDSAENTSETTLEEIGDTGDNIATEKAVTEERIVKIITETLSERSTTKKLPLSTLQLKLKCRETVENLEKKCNTLKEQLERTEANIAQEKLQIYRLEKVAQLTDEMDSTREMNLTKAEQQYQMDMKRIDDEIERNELQAEWLAKENLQLKWFFKLVNKVSFSWFMARLCCCSSTVRL